MRGGKEMHRGFILDGKLCYIDISIKEAGNGYQFISTGEYSNYDEAIAFLKRQRDEYNQGRKSEKNGYFIPPIRG